MGLIFLFSNLLFFLNFFFVSLIVFFHPRLSSIHSVLTQMLQIISLHDNLRIKGKNRSILSMLNIFGFSCLFHGYFRTQFKTLLSLGNNLLFLQVKTLRNFLCKILFYPELGLILLRFTVYLPVNRRLFTV